MKTIEIELSDEELCRIVGEHLRKESGKDIGVLEISETDDQCRVIRFRVKE
jgi:hypothetical protein